jgi:hypothetical protein
MARRSVLAAGAVALLVASCGSNPAPAQEVIWQPVQTAAGIVDVAGPRSDGRLVAAVGGGLELFGGSGLIPFTHQTGSGAYLPSAGESYLAVTPQIRLRKSGCSFHRDDAFAIGDNPDRVVRISRRGNASDFAMLASPFLGAIAFDDVGTFGHRLLVAGTANKETTLYAIDCRGRARTLTAHGPLIEGGMAVAPRSFGRFGGRLISVDEFGGAIYAFKPSGSAATVASPPLPTGGDIGVEALGFVPRLRPNGAAFLADRGVPGNPHPGTDSILRLTAAKLQSVGVRAGDLLVATEGGADTIVVHCVKRKACSVRRIGNGPSITHAEGHISFLGVRAPKRPGGG